MELLSFDELDFFSESDNDGSDSGSPVKYVDRAGDIGFGNFVPTGIKLLGDVFRWSRLYQDESSTKVVDS